VMTCRDKGRPGSEGKPGAVVPFQTAAEEEAPSSATHNLGAVTTDDCFGDRNLWLWIGRHCGGGSRGLLFLLYLASDLCANHSSAGHFAHAHSLHAFPIVFVLGPAKKTGLVIVAVRRALGPKKFMGALVKHLK